MKWVGISGTWKSTTPEVEHDVRGAVRAVMARDDGIISGGALGVDFFATDEAFVLDPTASRIKVLLPVPLPQYIAHLHTRQSDEAIAALPVDELVALLTRLSEASPTSVIGNPDNDVCNEVTYFKRNTDIVDASDELYAFCVNGSRGTMDTVEKARAAGKPVTLKTYTVS